MRDINTVAGGVPAARLEDGVLAVEAAKVREAVAAIKALGGFILFDITCVDRPAVAAAEGMAGAPACFEVGWRFMDLREKSKDLLTLRCRVAREVAEVPSVMDLWKSADVLEREVWDLMGVRFSGRAKLERILCADDFDGHPLRKDYVTARRSRFPEDAAAPGGVR